MKTIGRIVFWSVCVLAVFTMLVGGIISSSQTLSRRHNESVFKENIADADRSMRAADQFRDQWARVFSGLHAACPGLEETYRVLSLENENVRAAKFAIEKCATTTPVPDVCLKKYLVYEERVNRIMLEMSMLINIRKALCPEPLQIIPLTDEAKEKEESLVPNIYRHSP